MGMSGVGFGRGRTPVVVRNRIGGGVRMVMIGVGRRLRGCGGRAVVLITLVDMIGADADAARGHPEGGDEKSNRNVLKRRHSPAAEYGHKIT